MSLAPICRVAKARLRRAHQFIVDHSGGHASLCPPTLLTQKTAADIAADGRSPAKTEPLILDI
jgi:hypothetical protein